MLSLIVAYIRAMASKAQKSPKGQKKGQHGKKKAKQPLLGRIVFLFMGFFTGLFLALCVILYYCMLLCTMEYIVLIYLSSKIKYFCSYKVRQTLNGA